MHTKEASGAISLLCNKEVVSKEERLNYLVPYHAVISYQIKQQ